MSKHPITFRQYLARRGYDLHASTGLFLRRMFLSAWAQPGFHRFWRVWNPVYGYLLFRLYLVLGGNRRRILSTITVFLFCGFMLHDLPISIIRGHIQVTITAAFFLFGVVTLLFQQAENRLGALQWPRVVHVICNFGVVGGGLLFGVWVQNWLIRIL